MKKYTKITAVFVALLALSACQKEFLDRKPLGQLTYDTFFENAEQAQLAVNAVYNQLRQWDCVSFPWIGLTDIISDDADKGSTAQDALPLLEIDDFTFDGTNTNIAGAWRGYYTLIARANLAIKRLPDVDMEEAKKQRLIGECKFLRAYGYFLLVQWFGGVPLITEPLDADGYYNQERKPASAVYDQIEADLKAAIQVLPKKSKYAAADLGRATQGAALGFLAKLYMLKKDFVKAEETCLELINSNEYSLQASYKDIFLPGGENGVESIFEIQAAALNPADGVIGPGATPYNMIQGVRGVPNLGWGFNRPSDNLISAYETSFDPRRRATIIYEGDILPDGVTEVQINPETVNARYNKKAWVPAHSGLQDNGPGNIRVLRYADILLLAAEALNENGKPQQALTYLNMIRKRARGTSTSILQDVTVTDQSQLRERIYRERRVELAMEQHRWFDLLRWGRAGQVMQAVGKNFVPGKHELLPIPSAEIDLTGGKMVQNPGY
jgi:starch-binding outer membrane protein, SusD/RagB family